MESLNNAELIYEYAEKMMSQVNKSIDLATDKATKILAFSGILIKFAVDLPSERCPFVLKVLILASLVFTIGACASSLWPKSPGELFLKPEYLLEEQYGLSDEEMKVMITRSWIEAMPKLKDLLSYRLRYLNFAIASLIFAVVLFAIAGVVEDFQ